MSVKVGLTGSPSTGKTSVGSGLARRLAVTHVELLEVAKSNGCGRYLRSGEFLLDERKLGLAVRQELRRLKSYVVSGNYLWDFVPPKSIDHVFVLRCDPRVLKERYEKLGYPKGKKRDNLVAEAIGYVYFECLRSYGEKVVEVDTTGKTCEGTVRLIISMLSGRRRVGKAVDWLDRAAGDPSLLRLLL
jgi:broad-specificity NMP kinase